MSSEHLGSTSYPEYYNQPSTRIAWLAPFPIANLINAHFSREIKNQGTGTWLWNLGMELSRRQDIELHIITETGSIKYSHSFLENNIHFHLIKNTVPFLKRGWPSMFPFQELTFYALNSYRIRKILKKIDPDLVHAQGTENSYAISAIRSGYPNIISIQGVLKEIAKKSDFSLRQKIKVHIEALTVRNGKNFICRTEFDTSFVRSLNPDALILPVYEAVSQSYFSKKWKANDDKTILYVGSLQERKGIFVLLKALLILNQKYPDLKLFVIGRGAAGYIEKIKAFCIANILENVIMLGFQQAETISEYHLKSQILVCPSYIENSPNCIAEAMVTGLPAIASRTGGIPSMLSDGETGYLFEPGDHVKLAQMIDLLLSDMNERVRISINSRKVALSRYLPENVARRTLEVYERIIKTD